MPIGRAATTQDHEVGVTAIVDAMGRAGEDTDRIAGSDDKFLLGQPHDALASRNVIKLLTLAVAVQKGGYTRRYDGLGETLVSVGMLRGVH